MGQYDAAKVLGKEALDLEEKELGARQERMGDLNNMMASIISDVSIFSTFLWVTPTDWLHYIVLLRQIPL